MKPRYCVPSMLEIRSTTPNGLTVASIFTGAGGADLGFLMAGFRVRYANDWDRHSRDTYEANHDLKVDERDMRDVPAADIIRACGGVVHGLAMSPPCPSYSKMGKGLGAADERDRFSESVDKVGEVNPTHFFTIENVPGLAQEPHRRAFADQMRRVRAFGFRVSARVLDAQWLGVPQQRQRLFIVGVRESLGVEPPFPTPLRHRYGVGDACPDIVRIEGHEWFTPVYRSAELPMPTIVAGGGRPLYARLREGQLRKFTIEELAACMSFPTDLKWPAGSTELEKHARIGNAVPPLMMFHIATAIRDALQGTR